MGCSLFDMAERMGLGDLDDLLSYNTIKLVRVRDYRLGGLFYAFQIAVFIYVVVIAIIIDHGYMKIEQVQAGSAQIQVTSPGLTTVPSYCCTTPVCAANTLPCVFWDSYQATFEGEYSTTITTRAKITNGTATPAGCTLASWNSACTYSNVSSGDQFVANIETSSLRILHAVSGFSVDRSGSNSGRTAMDGRLLNDDGEFIRGWDGNRAGDDLTVQELLNAAGISLDRVVDGNTPRTTGLNVIIYVDYKTSGTSRLSYDYKARTFLDSGFVTTERRYNLDATERLLIERHGVRFIVVQTGKLGSFNFLTMLQTLVTGLALLAAATTVVDQVMTRIMTMRKVYAAHKTEVTEDFSSWRALKKAELKSEMKKYAQAIKNRTGSSAFLIENGGDGSKSPVPAGATMSEPTRTVETMFAEAAGDEEAEFYKSEENVSHA